MLQVWSCFVWKIDMQVFIYVYVRTHSKSVMSHPHAGLQSFWPGLLTLWGDLGKPIYMHTYEYEYV